MKCLVIFMFFGSAVWCMPNTKEIIKQGSLDAVYNVVQQCVGENTLLCLKEKALRYIDTVAPPGRSQLIEGVTIINEESARSSRSLEPLPIETTAREIEVESRLVNSITDFLEHAAIQINLPNDGVEDIKRSFEEESARKKKGGKKKLKKLLPLIHILKMKAQALASIFLGVLAFVAAKALLLLKIFVIASFFIGIRSLFSSGTQDTYEIIQSRPEVHSHHESHGYGGSAWGRLSEEPQDLAYSAYSNKNA